MAPLPQTASVQCVRCGASFGCDPLGECWCKDEAFRLPMPASDAESCLCPNCLREAAKVGS